MASIVLVTVGPLAAEMATAFGRRGALCARRRGGRRTAGGPVAGRRHGAREGLARRRAGACGADPAERSADGGKALNGPHSDRGDGGAVDLHLLEPEVHRVFAQARVRTADPRGRPGGASHQGGHADDGRRADLPGGLCSVSDPERLRMALDRGLRRGDRVCAAGLRRRLHQARPAPLARAARADEARS